MYTATCVVNKEIVKMQSDWSYSLNCCRRMTGIIFGNYFTNFNEMIAPGTDRFQGMFDTIIKLSFK